MEYHWTDDLTEEELAEWEEQELRTIEAELAAEYAFMNSLEMPHPNDPIEGEPIQPLY